MVIVIKKLDDENGLIERLKRKSCGVFRIWRVKVEWLGG